MVSFLLLARRLRGAPSELDSGHVPDGFEPFSLYMARFRFLEPGLFVNMTRMCCELRRT